MEKTFSRHYSKRLKIFAKSYKSVAMRARTLAARTVFKTPDCKVNVKDLGKAQRDQNLPSAK